MFEEDEEGSGSIQFDPPVYRQRYEFVRETLGDRRWCDDMKKIAEFGCAEMSFIKFLKPLESVNSILQIDCDESLLREFSHRARPFNCDYLSDRESPLNIQILHGSICDPDYRLIGTDGVVCIEVIEHLNPGTLDRVPKNIFGYIEPKIAIVTTPNADFNVLFGSLNCGKFRHADHRFEWTRQQFRDWAHSIVKQYPKYTVEFHGIGRGPEGSERLGCCSQAALFINTEYEKKTELDPNRHQVDVCNKPISEHVDLYAVTHKYVDTHIAANEKIKAEGYAWDNVNWERPDANHYKLIDEYKYPFTIDKRSFDDRVLDEIKFKIYLYKTFHRPEDCTDRLLIPIKKLLPSSEKLRIDLERLRLLLSNSGYDVVDEHVAYDLNQDRDDRSSEEEAEESQDNLSVEPWCVGSVVAESHQDDNWDNYPTDKSVEWI